jgi:Rit1 N-terminal domain
MLRHVTYYRMSDVTCFVAVGGSDESEALSFDYVPGAGDDEESWARGLTAPLLWAHSRALLAAGPAGIHALVAELAADSHQQQQRRRRRQEQRQQQQGQKQHGPGSHTQASFGRLHAPLPTGCAVPTAPPAQQSASLHEVVGAHRLWRLGATGIIMCQLPADGSLPPEIWRHADAVLDVGSQPQHCTSTRLTDGLAAGSVAPCDAVYDGGIAAQQPAAAQHSRLHRHVQGYKAAKTSLLDALPAVLQFAGVYGCYTC